MPSRIASRWSRSLEWAASSYDNPELLLARCEALSRLIPLLYFILLANSWVLAFVFLSQAPMWLTVYATAVLTLICSIRIVKWWRTRGARLTTREAVRELRRTHVMSAVLSVLFPLWGFMLFPYGDAFAKSHVAFFLTLSMIGSMLCLIHLRAAAMIVGGIVGGAFVVYFAATGTTTFVAMAINVMLVLSAAVVIILIQSRDFTRMINAQTDARNRERDQSRLLHMIDDMPVAVMTVDPQTFNINYVNETSKRTLSRIQHLLPIKPDELLGSSIDIFHRHPEHQRNILSDPANLPHHARIQLGPEVLDLQVSAVTANDGRYLGPMLSWAIVTKEVETENRIRQLARYDTLTGLANRNTFDEYMETNLASQEKQLGLLFIDLDGFKLINDTRGHRAGDALLRQVANRLRTVCEGRSIAVGRLGGDEFAVLTSTSDLDKPEALAEDLVSALGATYYLDHDQHVQIGASIGIALAPTDGHDGETLLSRADMALYYAKAVGKGTYKTFQPEMETRFQERVRLETKLRSALDNQEGLFVFFQPIVNFETGKVTAREALVRWYHPLRGWISPSEFIPVAEESGLIDKLGRFVLHRACEEAVDWEDGVRVAVNISASQLGNGTLAPAILEALFDTGLPPERLEIEVTETALVHNERDSIADLRRVHDLGVNVALDDFGTGYSSLAHLRAFSFDKIKIDGSFVRDALVRPDCAAVVHAVADLGKRLGVTVVAEGVETQEQLERAAEEGCREIQGNLFGPPEPGRQDAPIVQALNRTMQASSAA